MTSMTRADHCWVQFPVKFRKDLTQSCVSDFVNRNLSKIETESEIHMKLLWGVHHYALQFQWEFENDDT